MSVFPAASSNHVPQPWAVLMSDPVNVFKLIILNTHYFIGTDIKCLIDNY